MLANSQMKANRFARWANARKQYKLIMDALADGKTVVVATALRATKYDIRHLLLFTCKKDGVYVQRGKSLEFIGWSSIKVYG